ncbi:MAG: hypothetical protein II546_02300, partial [Prevotella sp.]|nr:hypothetical protein [Prevotella sp.]
DGTVSGDYTGSWSLDEGRPWISLELDGEVYKGVILEMNLEKCHC